MAVGQAKEVAGAILVATFLLDLRSKGMREQFAEESLCVAGFVE